MLRTLTFSRILVYPFNSLRKIVKGNSPRELGARVVSIVLVISLLATTTPAGPRTIVQLSTQWKADLAFWLRASNAITDLWMMLNGQNARPKPQESQEERDARVAKVEVYPGDVTVSVSDKVLFVAVGFDSNGDSVSGLKTKWRVQKTGKPPCKITKEGVFEAITPGTFTIEANVAGRSAQVTVTVLPGSARNLKEKPRSSRKVSSRDLPTEASPGPNNDQAKLMKRTQGANSERRTRMQRAHSSRSAAKNAPASAPMPLPPGDGWDNTNYWYADDPGNQRGNPGGLGAGPDGGVGKGNFQFTAPVLALPSRGLDVSLGLTYNSRVWSKAGSQIGFDNDKDWPAPGWSIGFGRVVGMGTNGGAMIVEADGTRRSYTGTIYNYSWGTYFTGHTTDGSFIDYTAATNTNGVVLNADATLANGTKIQYWAYSLATGIAYPTMITDPNGNLITISYVGNQGPKISAICDSQGRVINFHYDYYNLLTAITAPGLGGGTRTLVRLHYKQLALSHGWSGLTPRVSNSYPWVIDAIFYPGTNTGYWFNDSDSYSSYGMLAKVMEMRNMVFSASTLTEQGYFSSSGQLNRKEVYNYPLTPNYSLTDAPTYTTLTETWTRDGTNTDQAVTSFLVQENATNPAQPTVPSRKVEVTMPNLTKSIQYSYNAPGQFKDGLVYQDETRSSSGTFLQGSSTTWEQGYYSAPRPVRMEATNERSQTIATEFSYTGYFNQVTETRNYDYNGAQMRVTRNDYENSSNYHNRHIFNLPTTVDVFAGDGTTRVSRTVYQYDGQTLTATPNATQHAASYDPYNTDEICCDCCNWQWDYYTDSWVCTEWCPGIPVFDPSTDYRGNVTTVTTYADAANLTGAITEQRRYDVTGNLVTSSASCCQTKSYNYTLSTQYGYPLSTTSGSSSDPLNQITTSETFDFNTSVSLSTTDANGRVSQSSYDAASLRPTSVSFAGGGAHTDYVYDDAGLSVTHTTYLGAHPTHSTVTEQNVRILDGQGKVRQEKALGAGSVWDIVDTVYDTSGRISQQSLPYRSGDTIRWVTTTYDALSRPITRQAADTSTMQVFYNESTRPSAASSAAGETIRIVDAWGRERWGRNNAQQKLAEVVEPDPNGSGSVATNGMATTYSYDTAGNLTGITQGNQTRSLKYDSLNRVVAQKMAETSAAINNSGTFVGVGGSGALWSNWFRYDINSNVVQVLDARGVKTNLWYFNSAGHSDPGDGTTPDPLGRLQSISYDTNLDPNHGLATNHPDYYLRVLDAPTVTYQYRTKSSGSETKNITSISTITTAGVSTCSYTFTSQGLVDSKTLTLTSRPSYPFVTDFIYDGMDRVIETRYPAEYGNGSAPRKLVHSDFDVAGRTTSLTVDGQSHASNFVYNAASQTTQMKVGLSGANQITENYGFDSQTGLLDTQTVVRGASTTLLNYTYNYAGTNGKRTGQLVSLLNNLDHSKDHGYEYDAVGRLKRATGGQNVIWAQRYDYDRYGNKAGAYSYNAEQYIRNFYQWGLNRQPNSTELNNWLSTLQTAYAQGQSQLLTAMQSLGGTIFNSTEYANRNRSDHDFVYDLYKTYLFREPDQGGWDFWTSLVPVNGRSNIRLAFDLCPEFSIKSNGISPYAPPGGATVPMDGLGQLTFNDTNNRVTTAGWTYDAVGNQVRAQSPGNTWQAYQYDADNRLTRILADDKVTVRTSYTYGHDAQRLISTEPSLGGGQGQRTYYVGEGSVSAEYTEIGAATLPSWAKSYIYLGGRLLSTLTPNGSGGENVDYHHPDKLSTRLVTNQQNTSTFEQSHLPFGTVLDLESTGATNRRFTSYDRSTTTKLDYAVNRHYDPYHGRFTQIDPQGMKATSLSSPQTLNLYAYCANDPVNHSDPSGLGFFSFLKKVFKGIAKVLTSKWFIIAVTVALAVITIGSAVFGWSLVKTVFLNLGPSGFTTASGASIDLMVPIATQATTLGWVSSALQATLAVSQIGFSGKVMLRNALSFAASTLVSRVLSVLPPNPIGSGRTPPFGFQILGQALTESQANIVWQALLIAKAALDRPACRQFVGENAYQALRTMWDNRRITYFNGVQLHAEGPESWAGTYGPKSNPRTVLTYHFFNDDDINVEAKYYGISPAQRRAATLLHETRHALCPHCGYIEPDDDWTPTIINNCLK